MGDRSNASGNVICMGSIIMDISIRCPQFPEVGETMYTPYSYEALPGGKGANQAVAAARMGGNVKMLGRISTDDYGRTLETGLKQEGIDVTSLKKDESTQSGVAFVWVNEKGQNQIICSPAVNSKSCYTDYEEELERLTSEDIVIITLELSGESFQKVIKKVKEKKSFLILDPSGGDYTRLTPELMSHIDMIKPNEVEAGIITGVSITERDSWEQAIESLQKKGVTYPLISLGENGIIYKKNNQIVHVPGIPVKVTDTTAAGDTFIGAFAAKLSKGASFEESVEYGNKAASICVQHRGAQVSIPYTKDIIL